MTSNSNLNLLQVKVPTNSLSFFKLGCPRGVIWKFGGGVTAIQQIPYRHPCNYAKQL